MVALRYGTPEFSDVFKAGLFDLQNFVSALPTHQQLQNAWCDPSVRVSLGLDQFEKVAAKQAIDMQRGARSLLFDLVSDLGTEAGRVANFPMEKLLGLKACVQSTPILGALTEADVASVFNAQGADGKLKAAGNVALGIGLAAVGTAIPVVGQIGAAVVALGKAIYSILAAQQKVLDKHQAAVREALYKTFPPLQSADSVTDAGIVQNQLRAVMASQDWTSIFLPRFRGEWIGIERDKGFAFAPGKKISWSDEFAGDKGEAFEPSGGIGLIPGTSILTSVIQVNLDPRGGAFQHFMSGGGDPRGAATAFNPASGAQYVVDTGSFYTATARLGALAWEWATRAGSPYLYRLDAVRMHAEWKAYCDAGIEYLRERVFPWYAKMVNARANGGAENMNLEGFFGAAVYYGIGSWACQLSGGTDAHPLFTRFDAPTGWYREQMKKARLYPGSVHSGAFLPILSEPGPGFQGCMGTIYERNPAIRDVLNTLQARQRSDLRRSLVCAYVRRTDAAFVGDAQLANLLAEMRSLLLKSDDRFQVNILDVPENETHNGSDWRAQLIKSGVPALPNKFMGPGGTLKMAEQDKDPPPVMPPLRVGDPVPGAWPGGRDDPDVVGSLPDKPGSDAPAAVGGVSGRRIAYGAAAFGGLFAAGWALSKTWGRKSGPV